MNYTISLKILPFMLGIGMILFGQTGCHEQNSTMTSDATGDSEFRDKAIPEWSYDRPFYVRPVDGVAPVEDFEGPPREIYTQNPLLEIPRPQAGDPRKAPRVALWKTNDHGYRWQRIGYFGRQQSYYPHRVGKDGVYGFRFIGPGIPPARCKPPKPHLIFHVDTQPPEVAVFISPECQAYHPGQTLTVEWQVIDPNLKADCVALSVCISQPDKYPRWVPLGKNEHPEIGIVDLIIPDEAIDKTITIRVAAEDRAGNFGFGYSCPIPVVYEPGTTQPTSRPAASQPVMTIDTPDGPQVLTTMPQSFPDL